MDKRCAKCGVVKTIEEFNRQKSNRDGRDYTCRECRKRFHFENRESINSKHKIYDDKYHKEKIIRQKSYRQSEKGKEAIRQWQKMWRDQNPEKVKQKHKESRQRNPETERKYNKKYADKFPERLKAHMAVGYAVFIGKLEKAKSKMCTICHINIAYDYHHHKGYEKQYWLDVIPVCRKCHSKIENR